MRQQSAAKSYASSLFCALAMVFWMACLICFHIGLYRDPTTLEPVEYYYKVPEDIAERLVIVVDPMLATGNSAAAAIARLKLGGATTIKFVCLLAAPEGIKVMQNAHPDVPIITASIDQCLNDHGYIVPGLGDAGDRLFGTK